MVREPFQGAAHGRAVHDAGTHSGKSVGEIQCGQRLCLPTSNPAKPSQDAPEHHQ